MAAPGRVPVPPTLHLVLSPEFCSPRSSFIKFQTLMLVKLRHSCLEAPSHSVQPHTHAQVHSRPKRCSVRTCWLPLTAAGGTPVAAEEGRSLGWPMSDGAPPPLSV